MICGGKRATLADPATTVLERPFLVVGRGRDGTSAVNVEDQMPLSPSSSEQPITISRRVVERSGTRYCIEPLFPGNLFRL